jgi:hypothetical protein
VNDLGGHAFESWTSQNTGKMWLKDFLPNDVKGVRIMSYGYNSNQFTETNDVGFLGHRKNLLKILANARRSSPVCILLGQPTIYSSSKFSWWANIFPSKPKETAIDIYWAWDGRHLDTSGKATQAHTR